MEIIFLFNNEKILVLKKDEIPFWYLMTIENCAFFYEKF